MFLIRESQFHKTLSFRDFSCVMGQQWVICQATTANKTGKLRDSVVVNDFDHRPQLGVGPVATAHKIKMQEGRNRMTTEQQITSF